MKLTDEIIDMTYKFARTFMRRIGRTDIETHDLAHDASVKLANTRRLAAHVGAGGAIVRATNGNRPPSRRNGGEPAAKLEAALAVN